MKMNFSSGKVGVASTLLIALTGCTTYVQQTPPVVYTPPPAPVYVQPAPPPQPAPAVVVIQREDDFYQPLSPYGEWVVVGGYGRCWRPARVQVGWRPYTSGHWELTDAGWYWISDEPWGWATYHYGRWVITADYGWIWIPQTQWAPAWVSWREGGGYVGWAPLPPEPRVGVSINITIAPATFVFVEERRMHEPVRPTTVIINNTTIINRTVNITRTKIVNRNVVINEGPRPEVVERESGRKFERMPVAEVRHRQEEAVAEKHPDLKRPERKPEPVVDQEPRNVRPQHEPPGQIRKEARREATPAPVAPELQPQPAPLVPRPTRPSEDQANRERLQRDNNVPANPTPNEMRRREKPAEQLPPGLENRQNPPHRPQPEMRTEPAQADRAGQLQSERPNGKPGKQKNEPGAPNEKNKKAKKLDRTNAVDKAEDQNH